MTIDDVKLTAWRTYRGNKANADGPSFRGGFDAALAVATFGIERHLEDPALIDKLAEAEHGKWLVTRPTITLEGLPDDARERWFRGLSGNQFANQDESSKEIFRVKAREILAIIREAMIPMKYETVKSDPFPVLLAENGGAVRRHL